MSLHFIFVKQCVVKYCKKRIIHVYKHFGQLLKHSCISVTRFYFTFLRCELTPTCSVCKALNACSLHVRMGFPVSDKMPVS